VRIGHVALVVSCAAGARAAPAPAPAPAPDDAPTAQLEDPCIDGADAAPCKRHALDGFRAALAAQQAGKAEHALRVSYFGDSLTADDHLTDALRRRLHAITGDGGPGFVFAAPPHPFCQHRAVARAVSDEWTAHGISTVVPPDHLLGLGGSTETDSGGTIRLAPTAPGVRSLDLHYLAQPHGGRVEVVADGSVIATIATDADRKQSAFSASELPEGSKHLELRAHGRVRLFGASLEARSGAVVDNLGVVNATAKAMRTNNFDEHWKNQLAHRAPDLVVIMYGTNEAEWLRAHGAGMAEHEKLLGELLATVRAASPDGACLVVSPLDQLDWHDDALPARESVPAMVEAQRRAALAHGCAFWDVYAWMGGKGSSANWRRRGWLVKDYQHPTSEGAERLASALFAGLTAAH
jgi:lysophospholipase L1-like esterase